MSKYTSVIILPCTQPSFSRSNHAYRDSWDSLEIQHLGMSVESHADTDA